MKLYSGLAAAAAIIAIAGVAIGCGNRQIRPTGRCREGVARNRTRINIATAEAIGKACIDEATKEDVKVSVVIYRPVRRAGVVLPHGRPGQGQCRYRLHEGAKRR